MRGSDLKKKCLDIWDFVSLSSALQVALEHSATFFPSTPNDTYHPTQEVKVTTRLQESTARTVA